MRSTPHTSRISWLITLSGVRAYRKKLLIGKLAAFVEQEIRCIGFASTWTSLRTQRAGRSCASFSRVAPPSVAPSQIAHTLKGTTARKVFQYFPPRQETALGRRFLVSVRLCGECGRFERGCGVKIYRIGASISVTHAFGRRLVFPCIFGQETLDILLS
jgi:hypothetical protein